MELNLIQKIAIWVIPVIFAITLHEAAHGYVARYFGDKSAWMLGRVTLNPLKHIDPIGTILVPLSILIMSKLLGGGFILFGWAKPVPVNFSALRRPKQDMLWVALAGPAANLLMAMIWALVIHLGVALGDSYSQALVLMGAAGIFINAILMALNLLPLPPLDGGRVLVSLLPNQYAWRVANIEPYGFYILLFLMALGWLNVLLSPVMGIVLILTSAVAGVGSGDIAYLIQTITS
jgi:Zn-dependent protease|uniref:Putative Peptidase, M50 family n=1 Tax=mine drainage metagenome TaxID=410659 RepID=E6QS69_9ZZZZ